MLFCYKLKPNIVYKQYFLLLHKTFKTQLLNSIDNQNKLYIFL